MKPHIVAYLLFVVPFSLWAQSNEAVSEEIDLSDVVIIEDVPAEATGSAPEAVAVEVVEPEATEVEAIAVEPEVEAIAVEPEVVAEPATEELELPEVVELVEIPEEPVEGASIDPVMPEPDLPTVTAALPEDTDVVLELPGQSMSSDGATMAEEETISVDFPDEDVRVILFNVAELFDLNLVVPDTLQGRTSLKLHNITWRDVFDVVLEPLGYAYVEDRNIIKVKSIEDIAAEPVTTTVIAIKYARAGDIINSISPLVDTAAGGKIVSDSRKNLLIVTERPSRIQEIRNLVDEIDKATDQVMIETKFIEVFDEDIKNIGVNWASLDGYTVSAGPFTRDWSRERSKTIDSQNNSETGVDFDSGAAPQLTNTQVTEVIEDVTRLASTARSDTAVFNADQFRVVLSALETMNDSKLVTNPTVVVMNKREANFEVGRDYPIRDLTFNQETGTYEAGGVEEKFIGINLKVTPEVLGGNIHLAVDPTVSALDGVVESFGAIDPIIARRSVQTEVVIKDGFTLALGGLMDEQVNDTGTKVPVLGSLPGVGRLFRSDSDQRGTRNLIVFITAKTLNPEGSDYNEIIDPRMIESMGLVDSDLPGYYFQDGDERMSQQERDLLAQIEEIREEAKRAEKIAQLQSQIDALMAPAEEVVEEK